MTPYWDGIRQGEGKKPKKPKPEKPPKPAEAGTSEWRQLYDGMGAPISNPEPEPDDAA